MSERPAPQRRSTPKAKYVTEEQLNEVISNNELTHREVMTALNKLEANVTLLKTALLGNSDYLHDGLVTKIKLMEDYIASDRKWKAKIAGGMIVVSIVWTIIIKFSDKVF